MTYEISCYVQVHQGPRRWRALSRLLRPICSVCRRGYGRYAVVVDVHHFRVAVTAGLLLICPGAHGVCDPTSFEVVKGEPLFRRDDFIGKSQGDEALPSCV